jgi:hypothetical protein
MIGAKLRLAWPEGSTRPASAPGEKSTDVALRRSFGFMHRHRNRLDR